MKRRAVGMKQSGWCLTSRALPLDVFASGRCALAQLGRCARRNSPALTGEAGAFLTGLCWHAAEFGARTYVFSMLRYRQYATPSSGIVQDVCSHQNKVIYIYIYSMCYAQPPRDA